LPALLASASVHAQVIDRTAPTLDEVEDFRPVGIRMGAATILPSAELRFEYDSNLFATPVNEQDDFRVVFAPSVVVDNQGERFRIRGTAQAEIRRYFDITSEDSEAGLVRLDTFFRFSEADLLRTDASWQRIVEDRGDPEARNFVGTGPRLIDAFSGDIEYGHTGARFGFGVSGGATKFDYRAPSDAERDHTALRLNGRLSYRVGPGASVYVRPFYSARNFRLATDTSGIDRDSKTYGARAGVEFDPGGLVRGRLGVGFFRFDPDDPALGKRTGLSVQGSLIYQPTQRTAFTLEAFRGDVATFRAGASSREDTRVTVGIQQEIRHNLRWQSALFYRRSNFVNGGDEDTIGGFAELEFRINRFMALAVSGRYADRSSSTPSDEFDRFRGGLELRVRY
jgi:hypothetical protein